MAFDCPPRWLLKITFFVRKTVLFSVLICSLIAGRFEALIWRSLVFCCAGIMCDLRVDLVTVWPAFYIAKQACDSFKVCDILAYKSTILQ